MWSLRSDLALHASAYKKFGIAYPGARKPGSWTTPSKLHGLFLKNAPSRMELFTLIGMKRELS